MKEHPILFSSPMVRAILEGRKTQTRRVVKFHYKTPLAENEHLVWQSVGQAKDGSYIFWDRPNAGDHTSQLYDKGGYVCPYGKIGDHLWVRETWAHAVNGYVYRADYREPIHESMVVDIPSGEITALVWKPSIHMPRIASRILLEVTEVRVERLNDISESDAIAEGAIPSIVGDDLDYLKYRTGFQTLWDSINAERGYSWGSNPFVWVVSFQPPTKAQR